MLTVANLESVNMIRAANLKPGDCVLGSLAGRHGVFLRTFSGLVLLNDPQTTWTETGDRFFTTLEIKGRLVDVTCIVKEKFVMRPRGGNSTHDPIPGLLERARFLAATDQAFPVDLTEALIRHGFDAGIIESNVRAELGYPEES